MVPRGGVEPPRPKALGFESSTSTSFVTWAKKADDGDRTRDIELGKLALYQLSYARILERTGFEPAKTPNLGITPGCLPDWKCASLYG